MVIVTGRNKGRLLAVALSQMEAKHTDIEAEGAVEIGDFQVDVADPRTGGYRPGRPGNLFGCDYLAHDLRISAP